LSNVAGTRYDTGMASKSTSVRIDDDSLERLRRLSESTGVSVTRLISLAACQYADRVEQEGGLMLPLNHVAEGRVDYKPRKKKKDKQ